MAALDSSSPAGDAVIQSTVYSEAHHKVRFLIDTELRAVLDIGKTAID